MAPRSVSPFASPRPLRSPRAAAPKASMKRNISLCDLQDDQTPHQTDSLDDSRAQIGRDANSLLDEAGNALNTDMYQAAERAATDALQLFREIGDRPGGAKALRVIIGAYQGRYELEEAYARATEELERSKQNGNKVVEAAMMISLAELRLENPNSPKEIVTMAKQGLALAQQVQDRSLEAAGFLALSRAYESLSKGDHMMRAARASLEAYRKLGDRKGEAKAMHCLALASGFDMDIKEALRHSQEARRILKEIGLVSLEAAEVLSIVEFHRMNKDYAAMLQDAEEARALYKGIGQLHGESNALRLVIKAQSHLGEDDKALELAEAALTQFREQQYKRGEAIALDQIASILYNFKKYDEALEAALEALELVREMEDPTWEAIMLHSIAALHCANSRYEEAVKVAHEALWILEETGDKSGQAYVRLNTILQAQTQQQEYQEALSTASEAVSLLRELKDKKGEGTALLLAANVYKTVGYLEEAEKWLMEAQEIFEEIGERRLLAQVLHGIAKVHIARNEPSEAVRLGYEAHSLCKRARDKPAEAGTLLFTVEAHLSLIAQLVESGRARGSRELEEQLSKAEKAGLAAKRIADKLGHTQTIADCFYALSEVHLVSGNYKEALDGADQGIKLYQDVGYALGECTFVNMKAQALMVSGQNEEALVTAQEAVDMAKAMDDKPLEKLAQEILEKCLQQGQQGMQPMVQQQQFQKQQEEKQPEAVEAEPAAASEVEEEKKAGLEPALVSDMLHQMLREMIGSAMESDTPFMDAGVDSLMSIEFRSQVNSAFSGLGLSSTLTFDYPTIRELTGHIVEKSNNQ